MHFEKNSGIHEKTQVFAHFRKNSGSQIFSTQIFGSLYLIRLQKKTQVQQQKTQGLDQLLINEYSLGRPKKSLHIQECACNITRVKLQV